MLQREPTGTGWQVTLHSHGMLRFLPAAFLGVWLCGWALGEYFALTLLGSALQGAFGPGFLAGVMPTMRSTPPSREGLPLLFTFLCVWLPLWTLGGFGALSRLLSLLFGREVIRCGTEGLAIERFTLFPASRTRLDPRQVAGFRTRGPIVLADTPAKAVLVAQLGTPAERAELVASLEEWRKSFGPTLAPAADQSPVPGWQVVTDETGALALTPSPRVQHVIGGVLLGLGAACAASLAAIAAQTQDVRLLVACAALGLPGALCLYGGGWLVGVRESWHPRAGTLERRRVGFGRVWSREFRPLGLELRVSTGSEGDSRWTLVVSGEGGEQVLASSTRDANLPSSLGRWLAERAGVELVQKGQESRLQMAG
ncbi:MAG TPA: hypothetical protein VI504_03315 [Candidatus Eisenbacteria bacterium]|jgi:hypothetical protein